MEVMRTPARGGATLRASCNMHPIEAHFIVAVRLSGCEQSVRAEEKSFLTRSRTRRVSKLRVSDAGVDFQRWRLSKGKSQKRV